MVHWKKCAELVKPLQDAGSQTILVPLLVRDGYGILRRAREFFEIQGE